MINARLAIFFGLAAFGAVLLYLVLEIRAAKRAEEIGWSAICAVAAAGAFGWKLRTGGSLEGAVLWALLGGGATYLVLAGSAARIRMYTPRRPGRPLEPKDFEAN
ncbi:hypothetical protein [Phenylobacterium sp.]|uniref:hypothetical protein n=1 Tax=Phenylobacterium sp. TaxID=1871053 RepID=UPI0035AF3731